MKILFNSCSKGGRNKKVPYDLWTKVDFFCAGYTVIAFLMILLMPKVDMLDVKKKDVLDYIISGLIIVQWSRFYMFFLMTKELS